MKVLVYFKPKEKYDNFEGTRLRKSIKGALEVSEIEYVNSDKEDFDIAHFISPEDESKINQCVAQGIPVVVSALYCESDPSASFLKYKSTRNNRKLQLSQKALRVLNKANVILVPSINAKEFLENSGIKTRIEVIYPVTNISRFNASREDEKEIFYRYFREDRNRRLITCLGSADNIDGINAFIRGAKKHPQESFYFFFQETPKLAWKIKSVVKQTPSNLHFVTIPSDDIYRSALLDADVFMFAGYDAVGIISIYEAMAARCEIIIREQPLFSDILIDGDNCHIGRYSETIASILKDCLSGKICPTKDNAFKQTTTRGLDLLGDELNNIYKQLLMNKE